MPEGVTKGIIVVDASCWEGDGVVSLQLSGTDSQELLDEINSSSVTHLTKKIYKCDLTPKNTVTLTVGQTGTNTSHLFYIGSSISLIC